MRRTYERTYVRTWGILMKRSALGSKEPESRTGPDASLSNSSEICTDGVLHRPRIAAILFRFAHKIDSLPWTAPRIFFRF